MNIPMVQLQDAINNKSTGEKNSMSKHFENTKPKSDSGLSDDKIKTNQEPIGQTHSQDADRHLKIRHPRSDKD